MSNHTSSCKDLQLPPLQTGTIYKYYIPSIEEHVRVCDACRLKHWESILLKKWKLVGREKGDENGCMACAEEGPMPRATAANAVKM